MSPSVDLHLRPWLFFFLVSDLTTLCWRWLDAIGERWNSLGPLHDWKPSWLIPSSFVLPTDHWLFLRTFWPWTCLDLTFMIHRDKIRIQLLFLVDVVRTGGTIIRRHGQMSHSLNNCLFSSFLPQDFVYMATWRNEMAHEHRNRPETRGSEPAFASDAQYLTLST